MDGTELRKKTKVPKWGFETLYRLRQEGVTPKLRKKERYQSDEVYALAENMDKAARELEECDRVLRREVQKLRRTDDTQDAGV